MSIDASSMVEKNRCQRWIWIEKLRPTHFHSGECNVPFQLPVPTLAGQIKDYNNKKTHLKYTSVGPQVISRNNKSLCKTKK